MAGAMRRDRYVDVARRLLDHVRNRTTDMRSPVMELPVDNYRDPRRWQREVDEIFKRMPLLVAFSCELQEPGSYKATTVAGIPLLTTRAKDGTVRSFLNVCRHKGAHVVEPGCGRRNRFVCAYHGWTYDSTGRLISIMDPSRFGTVDKSTRGLVELHTAEDAGLIFCCLTPGLTFDLGDWMGEMLEEIRSFRLETWHILSQNRVEGPNWKVAMDGYIEFYHIATLHPTTLASRLTNNVMVCDAFGGHEFGPHQCISAPTSNIQSVLDKPEAEWKPSQGLVDVKFVFPNTAFAITKFGGMISQVFPGPTVDTCYSIHNHIYPSVPSNEEEEKSIAEAIRVFNYVVPEEDYRGGQQIQLGFNTNANDTVLIGENEIGPQRFHTALDHYLGAGSALSAGALKGAAATA